MILRVFLAVLLTATPCWPQEISQSSTQTSAAQSSDSQSPAIQDGSESATPQSHPASPQTLTVPAGARIPLSLSGQITSKSRPGDPVRAVTAFPVTVDTQVAIPVGTYVEGVIDSVNRRTPSAQIHFTRLVFASGYTMSLEADSVQAKLIPNDQSSPATTAVASPALSSPLADADTLPGYETLSSSAFVAPSDNMRLTTVAYTQRHLANPEFTQMPIAAPSMMLASYDSPGRNSESFPIRASYATPDPMPQQQPQQPQLPPLPNNSHVGLVAGIGVAFTAAFVLMLVLVGRHRGPINGIVFDNGWQFQMVLQNPLTVDLSKISSTNPEPAATN